VNRLVDTDPELRTRSYIQEDDSADREISLGTATILGIFFALALVCAGFFGFGYAMGRKSAPAAALPVQSAPIAILGTAKPAAGSPTASAESRSADTSAESAPEPAHAVTVALPTSRNAVSPSDRIIAGDKPAVAPPPAAAGPGTFMVQVAAVSSQDVADSVAVHHEPQDKLLHVQIGPFADKKEAEAMRQRVLGDGFNAIVK
jgi:DedD protein